MVALWLLDLDQSVSIIPEQYLVQKVVSMNQH